MAIPTIDYGETLTSGQMNTSQASIDMTPEMFDILSSGVYKDKILAVIREIICNARDANIEAGSTKAIEVHLPNRLEPWYSVRDYGEGISEAGVMNQYLKYGHSTKKTSNDVIGMMGIGSKSPFAYTDSFIVESYHKGVLTQYSIYKENGIPQVSRLSTKKSKEPSGLLVKIATRSADNDTFTYKLREFVRFFTYDIKVVGNSSQVNMEQAKPKLVAGGYSVYDTHSRNAGLVRAIMGGVVYDISSEYTEQLKKVVKRDYMLLNFNIGDLSVAASRESLSEDDKTKETVKAVVMTVLATFYKDLADNIKKCGTPNEAFHMADRYDLVQHDYRNHTYKVTAGAADVKYKNESLTSLILQGCITFRSITQRYKGDSIRDDSNTLIELGQECPTILIPDMGTGFVKVAKAISNKSRQAVVLVRQEDLYQVERWYGKAAVAKCTALLSDKMEELFPKAERDANRIAVAKSGLFTANMCEVREVQPDTEGVAILFERNTCVMEDTPQFLQPMDEILGLVKRIIHAGHMKDVYVVRKGGLPALKKCKIKVIKWDDVFQAAKKCYDCIDYQEYIKYTAEPGGKLLDGKLGAKYFEEFKAFYPLYANRTERKHSDDNTKGFLFLRISGKTFVKLLQKTLDTDVLVVENSFRAERIRFGKENAIISKISHWQMDEDTIKELIEFRRYKIKIDKKENKNVI